MRNQVLVSCVLTLCFLSVEGVDANSAEAVFAKVSPSVVLIKDGDGHGSGVVLTADGLILTCYEVVVLPIKRSVMAKVTKDGNRVTMTFKKIEVVSAHPTLDLALIRVKDAGGAKFIPITGTRAALKTGQECFAIGNPMGANGRPQGNTITKGLVSAASRIVDGQKHIQTSAAVNSGCAGGALCDKDGKLIGLLTFRLGDAENIGFALPMAGFNTKAFKRIKDRKGNVKKGIAYEKKGLKWYDTYRKSRGEKRDVALFLAYYNFRRSFMELAGGASACHNMGMLYYVTEDFENAKAFYGAATRIDPTLSSSFKILGAMALDDGDVKKAADYNYKGMVARKSGKPTADCAENYAHIMVSQKNYAAAAYCMRWATTMFVRPERVKARAAVVAKSMPHLTDAQFAYLERKEIKFSTQGLKDFLANRLPQSSGNSGVAIKLPELSKAVLKKILAGAPDPGPGGLTKMYPDELVNAVPAYGGAYIILQFKDLPKVGMFNVAHGKIDKYIEAEKNAVVAAAGGGMLIYQPGKKLFDCWRLDTMTKVGTKALRIRGVVLDVVGAAERADQVLISYAEPAVAEGRRQYAVMNTTDFTLRHIGGAREFQKSSSAAYGVHLRPDDRLRTFALWCPGSSRAGFTFVQLGDGKQKPKIAHTDGENGWLAPSRDGSRVYTGKGRVLSNNGGVQKQYECYGLVAIIGGNDFIEMARIDKMVGGRLDAQDYVLNVRNADSGAVMSTSRGAFTFRRVKPHRWMSGDRCVVASVHTKRVAQINPRSKEIRVWKLEVAAGAAPRDEDATPGKLWQRKLNFLAGTKIVLETGGPGAAFDSKTMTLSWKVPVTQKRGKDVLFLLSVTQPGAEEVYHRITVRVK